MDGLIVYGMLKWGETFKPIVKNLFVEEYLKAFNALFCSYFTLLETMKKSNGFSNYLVKLA
jgi:hypothetical protein